ncbi:MAG: gluconate 2-dehydrogenase subunit 3 family protein [Bacteroidota bacterium]
MKEGLNTAEKVDRREAVKRMALAMGYTLSAPALSGIMTSCSYEPKVYWKPQVLSIHQAATLEALAEAILPSTDTPGAKELGVPKFLDAMLSSVMSGDDKSKFTNELDTLMSDCQSQYGWAFEQCDAAQQKIFLDKLEADNPFQYPRIWGTAMLPSPEKNFFGKLKDLVTWGYFSTELAGESLLAYDAIPGKYDKCLTIDKDTKAWSLG